MLVVRALSWCGLRARDAIPHASRAECCAALYGHALLSVRAGSVSSHAKTESAAAVHHRRLHQAHTPLFQRIHVREAKNSCGQSHPVCKLERQTSMFSRLPRSAASKCDPLLPETSTTTVFLFVVILSNFFWSRQEREKCEIVVLDGWPHYSMRSPSQCQGAERGRHAAYTRRPRSNRCRSSKV